MLKNIFKDNVRTIRLNSNGFSYLNDLNPIYQIPSDDQELLVVITHTPPITIPIETYNPEKNIDYLKIQFETSDFGHIVASEFKDYALLNFLTTQELQKLEHIKSEIHYIPLFLFQVLHIPQIPENTLFIDVQNNCLQCSLLVHEELQFITYFYLNDDTDCLYHLMNICAQFQIEPKEMNLFYISLSNSLKTLLESYFTIESILK